MATPEEKEVMQKALRIQLEREALQKQAAGIGLTEDYGVAPADFTYEPEEPLVIEGRLPNYVAPDVAETSFVAPDVAETSFIAPETAEAGARNSEYEAQAHLAGTGFPTQAEVDAAVAADPIATEDYAGPMAAPTGEPLPAEEPLQDYGVSAFDPQAPLVTVEPTYNYNPQYDSAAPTIDPIPHGVAAPVLGGSRGGVAAPESEAKVSARRARDIMNTGQTGYNRVIQAMKGEAVLAQRQAKEMAGSMETFRRENDKMNRDRIQELKDQDVEAKRQVAEVQNAYNEIGEFKPDRDRWWNSRSTGQKIAAVISMLLSGYEHGKSGRGGTAPMMAMMMKVIDDDIQDQVAEYQGKRGQAKDKQSMYGLMRQKFGDTQLAHDATKNAYLELIKGKADVVASKYAGTTRALNAEKAIGAIEIKQGEMAANMYQNKMKMITAQNDEIRKQGKDRRDEEKLAIDKEKQRLLKGEYETPVFDKYGEPYFAKSKSSQKYVEEGVADQAYIDKNIDRMIKKIKTYNVGEVFKPSKIKADLKVMAIIQRGSLRVPILGPGTVQEAERAILVQLSPDGLAITGPGKKAAIYQLRALQRESKLKWEEQLQSRLRGYQPVSIELHLERVAKKERGK